MPSDALSREQGGAAAGAGEPLSQTSARAMPRKGLAAWIPAVNVLREYQLGWLRNDIVAGIVLSTMLVPVGIAYAVASGVPAIYGLYATIIPLLAYAIFGPSRILVLGPDSSLAPIILGVVLPLSAADPDASGRNRERHGNRRRGRLHPRGPGPPRLHHRAALEADPVRLHERHRACGAHQPAAEAVRLLDRHMGPLRDLWAIGDAHSCTDKANWTGRRSGRRHAVTDPRPQGSQAHGGDPRRGRRRNAGRRLVRPVGALRRQGARNRPARASRLRDPVASTRATSSRSWSGGLAVAIVAFADTSVLSRTYAARTGTRVDPNQEMVGLGAANLAAGLFQGFPISSSSSRTPVAEAAGAKTQMTGVVGALVVALVIVAAPNLFRDLPYAALAAVVIAAAIGLFEFKDLARIYRIQNWEFWLSILCTAGVAVFGAIPGIGIAILLAVIEFLWDGWRPHWAVLGKPEGVDGYHDMTPVSGRETDSGPGPVPLGCTSVLRQRGAVQPARPRCDRRITHAGPPRRRRCGADHQRRCDLRGRPDGTRPDAQGQEHRALLRRVEGPREGQAQAVRAARRLRRKPFLPDEGIGRQQLPESLVPDSGRRVRSCDLDHLSSGLCYLIARRVTARHGEHLAC